jgi:hypothetical protein
VRPLVTDCRFYNEGVEGDFDPEIFTIASRPNGGPMHPSPSRHLLSAKRLDALCCNGLLSSLRQSHR